MLQALSPRSGLPSGCRALPLQWWRLWGSCLPQNRQGCYLALATMPCASVRLLLTQEDMCNWRKSKAE
jgi:hypothetical protein